MIELNNVSAGYGKREVLRGVSVTFEKGKLCCIIGQNGSGKSTLLKTATGFITATAGEVVIDGSPVSRMKRRDVAKKISYLSQVNSPSDMTVEQLVLHGRFPHLGYPRIYTEADRRIASSVIEKTGLCEFANRPLSELSGGMRQKAYVAMALTQDTEYILLDEPTAFLDISYQLELMHHLRTLADGGRSIVAVMHDIPLAMSYADEIAVISDGTVLKKGPPEEICASGVIGDVFGVAVNAHGGRYSYDY